MTEPDLDSSAARPLTPEAFADAAGVTAESADYYDSGRQLFLVRNSGGRWLPYSVQAYCRILRSRGLKSKPVEGQSLSEIDIEILDVQNHRDVSYHGPLCGRNAGLIEENGQRFLVTEDMRLPEPEEGDWSTIRDTLKGLLLGAFSFPLIC